ncbi:MAG: hypothetical protein JXA03_14855 [Bacteroidales bacterium]|nr:hypothetical protein [Bacteroidales bacterium]
MKRGALLLEVALLLIFCTGPGRKPDSFTIQGHMSGLDSGMAYLMKRESGSWNTIDSTEISVNGHVNSVSSAEVNGYATYLKYEN